MKKFYVMIFAASLLFAGCAMQEMDNVDSSAVQSEAVVSVINARIDDGGDELKTALGTPNGKCYPVEWRAGDKININGAASLALTSEDIEDFGRSAFFKFTTEISGEKKAVYPAERVKSYSNGVATLELAQTQTYTAGNFDPRGALMLGKSTGDLKFSNAMAYIKLTPTGTGAKIVRMEITALGGEKLSGAFTTSDFATISPASSGESYPSVAIVCSTPVALGTTIIAAIPAQTYASGFMITLQDENGCIMQKSHTSSLAATAGKMFNITVEYVPSVPVASGMSVDGNFDDWKTVPAVAYSIPDGDVRYTALRTLKLTSDDKFVYAYMEIDEPGYSFSMPCDFFVDRDGDVSTGGKLTSTDNHETKLPYTDSGLEWYIEGSLHGASSYSHFASDFNAYEYMGKDGEGIFSGTTSRYGEYGDAQFEGKGSIDGNNIGRVEFKMARGYFGLTGKKMSMGIKLMDGANEWNCYGLLPQGVKGQDGKAGAVSMATLAMERSSDTPPVMTEPIRIDGSFDDWAAAQDVQVCKLPSGALLGGAHELRVAASSKYVYFYLDATDNKGKGAAGGVTLDFFMDKDANPSTGMYMANQLGFNEDNMFLSKGIDWYIQTNLFNGDNYHNMNSIAFLLECTGNFGQAYGAATVVNHSPECSASISNAKIVSSGDNLIMEWRIDREYFGLKGMSARFGLRYMNPGYTVAGALPQAASEGGAYGKADMFAVELPTFVGNKAGFEDDRWFRMRGLVFSNDDAGWNGTSFDRSKIDYINIAKNHHINCLSVYNFPNGTQAWEDFKAECAANNIDIEFQEHMIGALLQRGAKLAEHPDYFRMDEKGNRVTGNACPSSPEAIAILKEQAKWVAATYRSTNNKYYCWMDDGVYGGAAPICNCPKCKAAGWNAADQALIFENAILEGLRSVNPKATLAHLAYDYTIEAPSKVKPVDGIFLEFAPIHRSYEYPLSNKGVRKGGHQTHGQMLQCLEANLKVFPSETAQVLEYWVDASLASDYKIGALKPVPWNLTIFNDDLATYASYGIHCVTAYSAFIGPVYAGKYGVTCLEQYGDGLYNYTK